MKHTDTTSEGKGPALFLSLLPLIILVGMIASVVSVFGDDSLSGASQVALLSASAVCVAIGLLSGHLTFRAFEQAVTDKIASISQAIIILLLIGALGGAWMVSGVVPTLIYYGVQILHPAWFLPATCLICAMVSLMTGSSWTTIATIGVALMGIGQALQFGDGWIAGAIISGAYFGDKISPLSDTTIMASSTAGTPLFTHIRYMLRTTIPSFTLALLIYLVAGFLLGQNGDGGNVAHVREALDGTFHLSPWLLAVPVFTGLLIARRVPSIAVLFLAVLMACVAALVAQRPLLQQIGGTEGSPLTTIYRGCMTMLYGNTSIDTGVPELNSLVATRGMTGMMSTIWLIICAMVFGGAMTATGMLDRIMQSILRLARNTMSLVACTVGTGILLNLTVSDQYLSIILTGSMYGDTYRRQGHQPQLLSRSTEDSATVTSVLIPWNSCGMTQSSVLGIGTLVYAPFCFFNILSPLMSILMARWVRE